MSGGKGRNNATLKSWVNFVKKVQKEENISYPEAMKRAKVRKSEWKHGGSSSEENDSSSSPPPSPSPEDSSEDNSSVMYGGKAKGRSRSKSMKAGKRSRKNRTKKNKTKRAKKSRRH